MPRGAGYGGIQVPSSQPPVAGGPPQSARSGGSSRTASAAGGGSSAAASKKTKSIGHYMLGKTLGEGTFGKVRLGTHILTGEKVAVKILEKSRILEPADRERVSREINILKRIHHKNVVQLFEVIDAPHQIFLIMEFGDGGELFDFIVARQRLQEAEACAFLHQIVDGLEYLHSVHVIHRDLKPENLLITRKHKAGYLVKIIDFGLSNTCDDGRLLKTACGSPCYASPEMIAGKRYIGPLSDLWSMGVVLFAMLAGFLPFEDQSTAKLYQKILAGQYEAPDHLSPGARDLLRRILTTDPSKRATISDIRRHPWFCQYQQPPSPGIARNVHELDARAMRRVEDLGLDPRFVAESVLKGWHNHATTTYRLVEARMLKDIDRGLLEAEHVPVSLEALQAAAGGSGGDEVTVADLQPAHGPSAAASSSDRAQFVELSHIPATARPHTSQQQYRPGVQVPVPQSARSQSRSQSRGPSSPRYGAQSSAPATGADVKSMYVASSTPQGVAKAPVAVPMTHGYARHPYGEEPPTSGANDAPETADFDAAEHASGPVPPEEKRPGSAAVSVRRGRQYVKPAAPHFGTAMRPAPPPAGAMKPRPPAAASSASADSTDDTPAVPAARQGWVSGEVSDGAGTGGTGGGTSPRPSTSVGHYRAVPVENAVTGPSPYAPQRPPSRQQRPDSRASSVARPAASRRRSSSNPPRRGSARPTTPSAVRMRSQSPGPYYVPTSARVSGSTRAEGPATAYPSSARASTPSANAAASVPPMVSTTMVSSTSSSPPETIVKELMRVLGGHHVAAKQVTPYMFTCERLGVVFDLEVTRLASVQSLFVVRARCHSSDVIVYRELVGKLLSDMRL